MIMPLCLFLVSLTGLCFGSLLFNVFFSDLEKSVKSALVEFGDSTEFYQ